VREVAEERPGAREAVERPPFPGLLAFTEADAEHCFGREAGVEALWEKIRRRKLLGPFPGWAKLPEWRGGAVEPQEEVCSPCRWCRYVRTDI
jgi:hypothetical protein